jgi:hypothetical protein
MPAQNDEWKLEWKKKKIVLHKIWIVEIFCEKDYGNYFLLFQKRVLRLFSYPKTKFSFHLFSAIVLTWMHGEHENEELENSQVYIDF